MRVAVLMGGPSGEHEVSISSGWQILQHLEKNHRAWPVLLARDGRWKIATPGTPGDWPARENLTGDFARMAPLTALAAGRRLVECVDAVLVTLHGPGGEDGIVQGFLQTIGLPHTGSSVAGHALAMDKVRSKWVYRATGIPTPEFRLIEAAGPRDTASLVAELGLPLAVKAPSQGSSVGLAIVKNESALRDAIEKLLPLENRLLVEAFAAGRELTCGVIGAAPDGTPAFALPPTEIKPKLADYFDYRAKYEPGGSEELTPAPLDEKTTAAVRALALRCHAALGLGGCSRTDMILTGAGLTVLESNTLPGMTATSLLPQQAAAIGWSFTRLLDELLARAVRV